VKAVVGLIMLGCLATACSARTTASSTSTAATAQPWSLVALGDSVPRGTNCDCTPYPPLTADDLAASSGRKVTAHNDSVSGATTTSVLKQLESNQSVIAHVRAAHTVEIEIGANDVAYNKTCGTKVSCYQPTVPTIQKNLAAIVARTHSLATDPKLLVVLLDYWSVWLGGKYAAEKGDAYVAAAEQVTDDVNTAIKSTAAESGSAYVDLRAAFKGPSYAYDETRYLSSDGDHPNAEGHRKIAQAADAVIDEGLHI